jgi:uncharacterized protein
MTPHEFPIPTTDLDAGGREFDFAVRPAWVRLEDVTIHLHHPVTALLVPASDIRAASKDADAEMSAEELDVIPYSGETIALDDLVRDELVLEIPIVPLCSEDCPGISPPPAKEDATGEAAIDPRLRPLFRMKKE